MLKPLAKKFSIAAILATYAIGQSAFANDQGIPGSISGSKLAVGSTFQLKRPFSVFGQIATFQSGHNLASRTQVDLTKPSCRVVLNYSEGPDGVVQEKPSTQETVIKPETFTLEQFSDLPLSGAKLFQFGLAKNTSIAWIECIKSNGSDDMPTDLSVDEMLSTFNGDQKNYYIDRLSVVPVIIDRPESSNSSSSH